ncbi:hypothetical protein FGRMN_4508 [Fusarium graminum]|nr:hypothetical protein FGRMN_4508 [Fusarium graminum]
MRKVEHLVHFTPTSLPSNSEAWGLPVDKYGIIILPDKMDIPQRLKFDQVKFRMEVHRALLRGKGYYDLLVPECKPQAEELDGRVQSLGLEDHSVHLPSADFLNIEDRRLVECIIEEALPEDRRRFRGYLSHRPLALGLIASPAGFGKTTAGAAATIAMGFSLGPIMCSAPTHVAINNFANRIDARIHAICERYNFGKAMDDRSRLRHQFVLGAFNPDHEVYAFMQILQGQEAIDHPVERKRFSPSTHWRLPLSLTYWLLFLLRSPAVQPLHPDASPALYKLQGLYDNTESLSALRDLVTRKISWDYYRISGVPIDNDAVKSMMTTIMKEADFFCTTLANAERSGVRFWKVTRARGLAIDEAGNMNRADLYGLWGNTLLPYFLFGDTKQLPPTVMSTREQDISGNFLNRFAADCGTSPLAFFVGTGVPVYQLKTQLSMADGMFDMIRDCIYERSDFTYGPGSAITLPDHKVGRDLEAFFLAKFPGQLSPAPAGKLHPVFVHCEGSRVFVDSQTMSKRSPDQVKIALDLLTEAVEGKEIDPARVVCITPYKANATLTEKMRKRYKLLQGMPPAATVDSFQGQKNDVAVVIMGTAHPYPGPGFTASSKRLNVMLSRQKSYLIIVGDVNVSRRKAGSYMVLNEATGDRGWVKGKTLNSIYGRMKETKRFVTVPVSGREEAKGDVDGDVEKDKSSLKRKRDD